LINRMSPQILRLIVNKSGVRYKMKQTCKVINRLYSCAIKTGYSLCLLILILFWISPAIAGDLYPHWTLSGFGTIGLTRTDTDELAFYRDRSQERPTLDSWKYHTDSRLGIQVDVDFSDSLHATIQWVPREHMGNFYEQNLEWAFLRWAPTPELDIRIGRLGFDSFLLSEYRNVGYAYPWMRPPHEFYANVPISHFDGIDIKKSISLTNGYLSLKAYAGYSSLFQEYASIEIDGPVAGANIVYESENWKIRAGYTFIRRAKEQNFFASDLAYLEMDDEIFPGIKNKLKPVLSIKNNHFHFFTIGAEYDDGNWLINTEASYMDSEEILYNDTANAYLSIGKRLSNLTIYTLFGISKTFQDNISIPAVSPDYTEDPLAEEISYYWNSIVNIRSTNEKSVSIGLRWDFHPQIAFKSQWSHFWVDQGDTEFLWGMEKYQENYHSHIVNVISFGFDFIF